MTKTLLFLIMACLFFWLVLDQFYGKQIVGQFVAKVIPSAVEEGN